MKKTIIAILATITLLGCSKSERRAILTAPSNNIVDVFTDADTIWIIHKNNRNKQKNVHKLIRYDSCFYEISNGNKHLMMSNEDTKYTYIENGDEYSVNISKSSDGHRVTHLFRTSPDKAGYLYSYYYTKDLRLFKIGISDTLIYKNIKNIPK